MNPAAPGGASAAPHLQAGARNILSDKAARFTESVIREMTRLAMKHGAVNLAQGFPDFPAPAEIKQAAQEAIDRGHQSVRHHVGREIPPQRHRAKILPHAGRAD